MDDQPESLDFFAASVKQVDWPEGEAEASTIRRQVFIDEQGVPPGEEFDSADASARHWLALSPEGAVIGTARLAGDKIGRMAVLRDYRHRGVGSALLLAILRDAVDRGLESLHLDAQVHATGFYESMGFVCVGEEFDDVGIAHRPMAQSLSRYQQHRNEASQPGPSDASRQHIILGTGEAFRQQAIALAHKARRKLWIYSPELNPDIYNDDTLCQTLVSMVRNQALADIKILVRQPRLLAQNHHHLVELFHRLPSHIHIRRPNLDQDRIQGEFMVADDRGVLVKTTAERFEGYACHYAPSTAAELSTEFSNVWDNAEPSVELRQIRL